MKKMSKYFLNLYNSEQWIGVVSKDQKRIGNRKVNKLVVCFEKLQKENHSCVGEWDDSTEMDSE
jgi:hypothetical protein